MNMSFVQINSITSQVPGHSDQTAPVWINPAHVNCVRDAGDRMGQATITLSRAAHDARGEFSDGKDPVQADIAPAALVASYFPSLVCVKEFDRSAGAPSTDAYVNPARIKSVRQLKNFHILQFADGSELDIVDAAPFVNSTI
jgi:hypothetical protein